MKITKREQFNTEQLILANKLLEELIGDCHELEEFSSVRVFGLKEDKGEQSILIEIDYSKPEKEFTIFGNY